MSNISDVQVNFYTKYGKKHEKFIRNLLNAKKTCPPRFARNRDNLFKDGEPEKAQKNLLTFDIGSGWYHRPYLRETEAKKLWKTARSVLKTKHKEEHVESLLPQWEGQ